VAGTARAIEPGHRAPSMLPAGNGHRAAPKSHLGMASSGCCLQFGAPHRSHPANLRPGLWKGRRACWRCCTWCGRAQEPGQSKRFGCGDCPPSQMTAGGRPMGSSKPIAVVLPLQSLNVTQIRAQAAGKPVTGGRKQHEAAKTSHPTRHVTTGATGGCPAGTLAESPADSPAEQGGCHEHPTRHATKCHRRLGGKAEPAGSQIHNRISRLRSASGLAPESRHTAAREPNGIAIQQ